MEILQNFVANLEYMNFNWYAPPATGAHSCISNFLKAWRSLKAVLDWWFLILQYILYILPKIFIKMRFLTQILRYITDENKNWAHRIEEKYNNRKFKKHEMAKFIQGDLSSFRLQNRASITIKGNTALPVSIFNAFS